MRSLAILGKSVPSLLMLLAAVVVLQHELADGFQEEKPMEVLLVMGGLLIGAAGFERLLSIRGVLEIQHSLANIGDQIEAVKKVEILIGKREIEAAAVRLVSDCDLQDTLMATAQFAFKGGLSDRYYKRIKAKMMEAVEDDRGFSYRVVVSENGSHQANERRISFFGDMGTRYRARAREIGWPFDVLIGGDGMILTISGQNHERYNCGFYIKNRDFVRVANRWFEEVIWHEGRDLKAVPPPTQGLKGTPCVAERVTE